MTELSLWQKLFEAVKPCIHGRLKVHSTNVCPLCHDTGFKPLFPQLGKECPCFGWIACTACVNLSRLKHLKQGHADDCTRCNGTGRMLDLEKCHLEVLLDSITDWRLAQELAAEVLFAIKGKKPVMLAALNVAVAWMEKAQKEKA